MINIFKKREGRKVIQSLLFLLVFVISTISSAAVQELISLQGKVTTSAGALVSDGNLTVLVYDSPTGGNLVYNSSEDFNTSIQSGSFDVLLGSVTDMHLNLSDIYYMDLEINGEDVDWDGEERKQFQSGVGREVSGNFSVDLSDSTFFVDEINNKVGIGTILPGDALLNVTGTIDAWQLLVNGTGITATGGGWTDDGAIVRLTSSDDIVGIGTSTPEGGKLYVAGNGTYTGDLVLGGNLLGTEGQGASGAGLLGWTDDGAIVRLVTSTDRVGIGTSTPGASLEVINASAYEGLLLNITNGATDFVYNATTGNVGIGTTTPGVKLDIYGSTLSVGTLAIPTTDTLNQVFIGNAMLASQQQADGQSDFGLNWYYNSGFKYRMSDEAANMQIENGNIRFQTAAAGTADAALTWLEKLTILNDGSVGIGTSTPSRLLDVKGNVSLNDTLYVTEAGNVGIGTTSPGALLETVGGDVNITNGSDVGLYFNSTTGSVGIGTTNPATALDVLLDINKMEKYRGSYLNHMNAITFGVDNNGGEQWINLFNMSWFGGATIRVLAVGDGISAMGEIKVMNGMGNYVPNSPTFSSVMDQYQSPIREVLANGGPTFSDDITIFLRVKNSTSGGSGTLYWSIIDGYNIRSINNMIDSPNGTNQSRQYFGSNTPSDISTIALGDETLYVTGGNVGINTTSPDARLVVDGSSSTVAGLGIIGSTSSWYFNGGTADAWLRLYTSTGGTTLADLAVGKSWSNGPSYFAAGNGYWGSDGKVGIGTQSPGTLLETVGGDVNITNGSDVGLYFDSSEGCVGIGKATPESVLGKLIVYQPDITALNVLSLQSDASGQTTQYFMVAKSQMDGTADNEFVLRNDGWGFSDLGWTTPADYAEYFYSDDATLKPGELICVAGGSKVKRCSADGTLIGVISTKPGILGVYADDVTDASEKYENDPHWVKVGLLGQVPTEVSVLKGTIKAGDQLTLGANGKAMKGSSPRTLLMIALEDAAQDETIRVLIK